MRYMSLFLIAFLLLGCGSIEKVNHNRVVIQSPYGENIYHHTLTIRSSKQLFISTIYRSEWFVRGSDNYVEERTTGLEPLDSYRGVYLIAFNIQDRSYSSPIWETTVVIQDSDGNILYSVGEGG